MKKLLALSLLLCSTLVQADYIYDANDTDTWTFIDTHTIILNKHRHPYVLVKLPFCFIYQTSSLQVLTENLGIYDGKILIDNEICEPNSVTKL